MSPEEVNKIVAHLSATKCTPAGCWEMPAVDSRGYAHIQAQPAHRQAWRFFHDIEIPAGLVVRHLCHNKRCVAPAHLAVGTHAENRADEKTKIEKRRMWCRGCFTRHPMGEHIRPVHERHVVRSP